VAVGVILRAPLDSNNFLQSSDGITKTNALEVCISLRPKHLHKGGLWEFPGGKIEQGETPESALERELYEELGIRIKDAESMMKIPWSYPEKNVLLEVIQVTSFEGLAFGQEGQEVKWVRLDQLRDYQFPEANQSIVDSLLAG